jgi:2-polyprenyl-3-methyl-5-hydroxy-6-metoxy-1,4-benzoquinol methylase
MTHAPDPDKLQQFLVKFVGDLGAVAHAPLVLLGDKLGLYAAMKDGAPVRPGVLAEKTGTDPRYIAEWLAANAASGYVTYDRDTGAFSLSPEQAAALAEPDSPAAVIGGLYVALSMYRDLDHIADAFLQKRGVGWHEHDACLFTGTARFFRASYVGALTSSWLPALDGVVPKLEAGAQVADVGCGHGASTILMAQAYPKSRFVGFDYHPASIEAARQAAQAAGVAERCRFEVASAKDFTGTYDLVACFDCLHDMGDPAGAARHVKSRLADGGSWMIVEPFANDRLEDNLNPVGRVFYSASTFICTPASRSQEVGLALGAQAGEARLREVVLAGGFRELRRATETPFNLVLQAR